MTTMQENIEQFNKLYKSASLQLQLNRYEQAADTFIKALNSILQLHTRFDFAKEKTANAVKNILERLPAKSAKKLKLSITANLFLVLCKLNLPTELNLKILPIVKLKKIADARSLFQELPEYTAAIANSLNFKKLMTEEFLEAHELYTSELFGQLIQCSELTSLIDGWTVINLLSKHKQYAMQILEQKDMRNKLESPQIVNLRFSLSNADFSYILAEFPDLSIKYNSLIATRAHNIPSNWMSTAMRSGHNCAEEDVKPQEQQPNLVLPTSSAFC